MTQGPPPLPDRSPVSMRFPRWPVFLSIFTGLMAVSLIVFVGLAVSAYLDFRQIVLTLNKTPELPQSTDTPTIVPTGTPEPAFQFAPRATFSFDEPVQITLKYNGPNLDQVNIEIFDTRNENLSDKIGLEKKGDVVTIPPQRLVGRFNLRAILNGSVLAELPIEIESPRLALRDLLDVQPPLEINGKYILLQSESKITLKQEYKSKGWSLSTQQPGFRSGGHFITFVGSTQSAPSLNLTIKITEVYDSQGGEYQHKVELPLVKLSPIQVSSGSLYAYDIDNACTQIGDAPGGDKKVLEDLSVFRGKIFDVSGLCDNGEAKVPDGYQLVIVISSLNPDTLALIQGTGLQQSPGLSKSVQPTAMISGTPVPTQSGIPGLSYLVFKGVEEGNPLQIALFGLIKQ